MRHYLTVSTPKPYRTRAQALLESVSSFLQFNERGEIYDKEHNLIDNSRLEDLIQYAVRDKRRNINPTGWPYFLTLLLENNIPKSILNRSTIEEMEEMSRVPTPVIKQELTPSRKDKSPYSRIPAPIRKSTRRTVPTRKVLESFMKYK